MFYHVRKIVGGDVGLKRQDVFELNLFISDVKCRICELISGGFPLQALGAQGMRARVGQSVASQVSLDKEGNEMLLPS